MNPDALLFLRIVAGLLVYSVTVGIVAAVAVRLQRDPDHCATVFLAMFWPALLPAFAAYYGVKRLLLRTDASKAELPTAKVHRGHR